MVSIRLRRPAAFDIVNYLVLTLFSVTMLYPFVNTAAVAFSDYGSYLSNPLRVLPGRVSFAAFQKVFDTPVVFTSYMNSIIVTGVGVLGSLAITATTAYPLSKPGFKGRGPIMKFIIFTMLFGGGLIPVYFLFRSLGLINSLGAVILKPLLAGFNVILMKVYFEVSIPDSIEEAAIIDGASDLQVLFKIVVPLSAPMMATIGLFQAVGYWNNFYWPLIFLQDTSRWTLPILLREIITEASNYGVIPNEAEKEYIPPQTIKNAALIITIVPIICVYPFLQRHFTKGIMLGAVKE